MLQAARSHVPCTMSAAINTKMAITGARSLLAVALDPPSRSRRVGPTRNTILMMAKRRRRRRVDDSIDGGDLPPSPVEQESGKPGKPGKSGKSGMGLDGQGRRGETGETYAAPEELKDGGDGGEGGGGEEEEERLNQVDGVTMAPLPSELDIKKDSEEVRQMTSATVSRQGTALAPFCSSSPNDDTKVVDRMYLVNVLPAMLFTLCNRLSRGLLANRLGCR